MQVFVSTETCRKDSERENRQKTLKSTKNIMCVWTALKIARHTMYVWLCGKTVSVIYYECECVCVQPQLSSMQSACALLSFVACLAVPHFSKLSEKRHNFRKKVFERKCFFTFSRIFRIVGRTERDIIINVFTSSCKVPVCLVRYS